MSQLSQRCTSRVPRRALPGRLYRVAVVAAVALTAYAALYVQHATLHSVKRLPKDVLRVHVSRAGPGISGDPGNAAPVILVPQQDGVCYLAGLDPLVLGHSFLKPSNVASASLTLCGIHWLTYSARFLAICWCHEVPPDLMYELHTRLVQAACICRGQPC